MGLRIVAPAKEERRGQSDLGWLLGGCATLRLLHLLRFGARAQQQQQQTHAGLGDHA